MRSILVKILPTIIIDAVIRQLLYRKIKEMLQSASIPFIWLTIHDANFLIL